MCLDKHASMLASMHACMYAYSMHALVYPYMRGRVHMFVSMQSLKLMCRCQCSWQASSFIYTHTCKKYPLACAIMYKCIHVSIHAYKQWPIKLNEHDTKGQQKESDQRLRVWRLSRQVAERRVRNQKECTWNWDGGIKNKVWGIRIMAKRQKQIQNLYLLSPCAIPLPYLTYDVRS